ncbi:hypothetical protein Tco_0098973 [Tanacetum coccineum]
MKQPQRQADVYQDEMCPPNKRYALMDANKKIELDNLLCLKESKILANILQNHPFIFSIAASLSVPWIYLGKCWHTLKEDGSKYRLKFVLDRKELTMTLDDFKAIFQLPQATNNSHERFVAALKFSEMVPFYINDLSFTLELRSPSKFKTTGLVQPWQTLYKMFSGCLTTRVTGFNQLPLQIMKMLYCFVNNVHVDYTGLLWEGLHYSFEHTSTLIPYPRFTKIIVRKNKAGVGMKIPNWMITDEMKLIEHYRMYATVFGVDVPTNQSQPIESTQGTHRTTSTPRLPNPNVDEGESSAPRKSTVIRLLEGTENVENAKVDSSTLRKNDKQNDPDTRLEPMINKESSKVEITAEIQPVNTIKEEEESAEDDYELR